MNLTGAIRAGVTDASGAYQFQQLQPGIYALEVDAPPLARSVPLRLHHAGQQHSQ
ncbi:hypothetical protein [Terriglobus albidus]|uniref:hypothetical protein n=1 Tax=Terriglobus albidus TaxID=1592106 RepID=UPI00164EB41D|nr:hypothetical protein [Terriglobus albidus]